MKRYRKKETKEMKEKKGRERWKKQVKDKNTNKHGRPQENFQLVGGGGQTFPFFQEVEGVRYGPKLHRHPKHLKVHPKN